MKKTTLSITAALCALSLPLSSCTSMGDNEVGGTAIGAATGALAGGIIGNNVNGGNSVAGALIGATVGGLLGNRVGHQMDDNQRYQGTQAGGNYPVATRTQTSGYVISPYAPNHMIDVRGIPSGALVTDPSCNQNFINP